MKTNLIHCSYHKCLTKYYDKIMSVLYNRVSPFGEKYKHFKSNIDSFYSECNDYRISSINNHNLDFHRLGDFRISRFIRDPRDLVVSGYFYHLRGAEKWCHIVSPDERDWIKVNGFIPVKMKTNDSFFSYLQNLNQEDGLIAEIDFRKHHFESMLNWPVDDHRIKTFRYEDLIGNEQDVFSKILSFYEVSWTERKIGAYLANKFSASKNHGQPQHVRDPRPKQWETCFTPKVEEYFNERYLTLLERLEYV